MIVTKYYVHKCRFAKSSPSWALKNELFLFQRCQKIDNAHAKKWYSLMVTIFQLC